MPKPIRICWDSCNWIAIINNECAIKKKNGVIENRFAMCNSVLKHAQQGSFKIVVSELTLTEVSKGPHAKTTKQGQLPAFLNHPFILVVPVYKNIDLRAQALQGSVVGNLQYNDAVHIVTAQYANAEKFHTFDRLLLNLDGAIKNDNGNKIKICKPGEGNPLKGLFEEKKP